MRKSDNKWGSHLMFLDVGLCPASSRVFQHGLCVQSTLVVVLSHRCVFPSAVITVPKERLQNSSSPVGMSAICPAVQYTEGHVTQGYVDMSFIGMAF